MIGRLNGVQGSLGGLGTISRLGNGNRLNLRHLAASRPTRGSGSMRATSCGIWAVGMTFRVWFWNMIPKPMTTRREWRLNGGIRRWTAVCPELPGCASDGETEEQARANIREAIELRLAPGDLDRK